MKAAEKGGNEAHAFSKAANEFPPDLGRAGLAFAEKQPMEACMDYWRPRWTDPIRIEESRRFIRRR